LSKPVHIAQRGATVAEITNLAAISVVDAEQRRRQNGGDSGS
jgi:phosphotransacetylase